MQNFMLLLLMLCCLTSEAQTMIMNDETTDVTFETIHLTGSLEGTVKGVHGTAVLDSSDLSNSYIRFSLSPATFIHNDNYLGPNLFKESCFDTKKNPEIDLVSGSISKMPAAFKYQFKGALIIKGKSRDITFPFTAIPNVGGYDLSFQFAIVKKTYELKCAFRKKLVLNVRAYAKRQSTD